MTPVETDPEARHVRGLRAAAGIFAGFALLALVNGVAIAATVPGPSAGIGLRLAHHVFDAAETLGVGAVEALAVGAFVRFVRLPPWGTWGTIALATVAITFLTNREFLGRVASQAFQGRFESAIFVAYLVLIGACFADVLRAAAVLGQRPGLRFLPVAAAAAGMAMDHVFLSDDYFSVHCLAAWIAAMVGGAALAPLAEEAGRALARGLAGRVALGGLALLSLVGVAWSPSNAVRAELFRQPCAVAPWILATTLWSSPSLHAPVAPSPSSWDDDRAKAPAVPPTTPRLLPADAVVVLITVDALRADAVSDPANDALFPTFARMKRDGVFFTHATAPGAQTPVSLSALFSGVYFSELAWGAHGTGGTRYLYPAEDSAPRFPGLLSDHGVATANYAGLVFLGNDFGVARGFREERVVVEGRNHAQASELVDLLLERLKRAGPGPLFLYTHLMEPHAPYDRGARKEGTDHERYLSEVAVADAAIGQVQQVLAASFGKRWALFVGADHGEAFGEHGNTGHAKTLYEELVHVPLLAQSPLFPARVIDERVGLIDLGPTILDLFGVDTPATYDGQSLVPILAGGARSFSRPLLAEGRLRRELTQPDGFKVIDDPRRKVVETYDLVADPGETRNLFDLDPARSDRALASLRNFFAVHRRRTRDGHAYEPPYDP